MTQETDPALLDAVELVAAYKARTLSPVEATEAALGRIERFNPAVNAMVHVAAEQALAAALESEARWMAGEPAGPVDGVPITIKDLTPVRGMPMRRGSKTTDANWRASTDAPFVARMRRTGAVILGMTASPEFGWKGVTDSPLFGITRNPWNTSRTPGGSSGGAAVAAALGMGALHQGSDAGGSIRIPAAFTGIFGIKPTFGWAPQLPSSVMTHLSHLGPMTRGVADAALCMRIVAGDHDEDWYATPSGPIPDWPALLGEGVAGLRVAYSPALGYAEVDPEVAASVATAVKLLESLGAVVEEADPGFDSPLETFETLWFAGAARLYRGMSEEQRAVLDPDLRAVAEKGLELTAVDWLEADAARAALGAHMARFHRRYDLLVTPTMPGRAFAAGQLSPFSNRVGAWVDWTPFSYPFDLTQQPAASICCGLTSDRLPVGLHIVGPKQRDDLVFRAAYAYEQAAGRQPLPDAPIAGDPTP